MHCDFSTVLHYLVYGENLQNNVLFFYYKHLKRIIYVHLGAAILSNHVFINYIISTIKHSLKAVTHVLHYAFKQPAI